MDSELEMLVRDRNNIVFETVFGSFSVAIVDEPDAPLDNYTVHVCGVPDKVWDLSRTIKYNDGTLLIDYYQGEDFRHILRTLHRAC